MLIFYQKTQRTSQKTARRKCQQETSNKGRTQTEKFERNEERGGRCRGARDGG